MKKRGLGWPFWAGVAYLIVLALFAAFGPGMRHPHDASATQAYGAGLRFDQAPEGAKVRSVQSGTPAAAAGIEVGDVVTHVGGESLGGLSQEAIERLVRGEEGSVAELTVARPRAAAREVELERTLAVAARPFVLPSRKFWLGTDANSRDVFARLAYGARMSLLIAFSVQIIALVVGIVMGTVGVFGPKWISIPVLRLTDGMFAFPDILLALLIVGIWNKRFEAMIIALSITAWPAVARLVRTVIASLKDREYVTASRALGASTGYLVVKHILPHLWGILLAVAMIDVAAVILAESALSFLGIGIQDPTPSWGGMIEAGRVNMNSHPIMLLWPCLVLSITIFALNFVGDGLRTLADPKSR